MAYEMGQTKSLLIILIMSFFLNTESTLADAKHGIAMYGEPDLPQDFVSLPYVNTNAPQGGRLIFGERGGFDSFNPFILKGKAPYGIKAHTFETLLGRSYDEPFTLCTVFWPNQLRLMKPETGLNLH